MDMTNTAATATLLLRIQRLTNPDLAVANVCMQLYGKCDASRNAYQALREQNLIDEAGYSSERPELIKALAFEVIRRQEEGTFT